METLTGRLCVSASTQSAVNLQSLVDQINQTIKPARPATLDSVYIGVLLAASNQINAQGGCFAESELRRLADLVIDAPVLIGHRKDELPTGRIFKGEIVDHGGTPWLRAYFYWHRDQTRADEIKTGIDAGIYKECSLGFLYAKPECGICRGDMRHCRHRVNEVVRVGDRDIKTFYYYKSIERVLEISLVYRGAVAGTSVSTLIDKPTKSSAQEQESKSATAAPDDNFRLCRDHDNNVWLLLQINGHTTCLRLVNFYRRRQGNGQCLTVSNADHHLPALASNRRLHLLDQGSVAVPPDEVDHLLLAGNVLKGQYRFVQKGESR